MIKAVGLAAVGMVLVASACSDSFESCKETRTCTPTPRAGAGGEGGEQPGSQAGEPGVSGSRTAAGTSGGGTTGETAAGAGVGAASGAGAGEAGTSGAGGDGPTCPFVTCECEENDTRPCGPETAIGICKPGIETCSLGSWGACMDSVEPLPRDCTSALDNDCDGKPDNTIDDSCKCVPGAKEACGEHPGHDGNGPCKAGERTCMGSGNSGIWGECIGSVAPKATDRCDVAGNDDSCDGQENGGCTCLSGEKSSCLDVYTSTKGVCGAISLTCTSAGKWPSSAACAATKSEACLNDNKDEDCDGQVNEEEDCDCVSGQKSTCSAEYDSKGVCSSISLTCTAAGKWPAATACAATQSEICAGDGKDEDCDGQVNEPASCDCTNGDVKPCGDCGEGTQTCTNGKFGACNATGTLSLGKGPKLLCIKGGKLKMGSLREAYEQPIHDVTLSSYWMDETEVTVGQYKACVAAGGCTPASTQSTCLYGTTKSDFPINCVNKDESAAFCSWAGKRLATEQEWEYAAKGTTVWMYPWGDDVPTNRARYGQTEPVAVKTYPTGKSPFGLFDMAGNVREWTSTYPCAYTDVDAPANCPPTDLVMTRGGYYGDSASSITTTYRYSEDPDGTPGPGFGFRCAKDK